MVYETVQLLSGERYEPGLHHIDRTTLIGLGLLTLKGVFSLRRQTDLQAVSFTLVAAGSFVFCFEALYKWSFYRAPFDANHPMPPAEIREFIIQAGIAAAVITGFAVGLFSLRPWTFFWLSWFAVVWVFWQLVGFPQLTGDVFFPKLIPLDLPPAATYLLSRSAKALLLLVYLTFFPALRGEAKR